MGEAPTDALLLVTDYRRAARGLKVKADDVFMGAETSGSFWTK